MAPVDVTAIRAVGKIGKTVATEVANQYATLLQGITRDQIKALPRADAQAVRDALETAQPVMDKNGHEEWYRLYNSALYAGNFNPE